MSLGFKYAKGLVEAKAELLDVLICTPSTTYKGSVPPLIEPIPRIRT